MSVRTKRYLVGGWLLLVLLGAGLTQWLNASSGSDGTAEPGRAVWERDCSTPSPFPSDEDGNGILAIACVRTDP